MTPNDGSKRICLAILCLVVLVQSGCASYDWRPSLPWQADKTEIHKPNKLVAVWNETVKYTAGQPAMRGFGGRILFYGEETNDLIKVDGTLVVYGFDEAGRGASDAKPDRKFVFPAELLEKHYSEAKLGPSYSFWLPWDAVGGERKDIALIARFQPRKGSIVVSPQTNNLLSGRAPVAKLNKKGLPERFAQFTAGGHQDQSRLEGGVRPVAFDQQLGINRPGQASASGRPAMSTTTISLPAGYRGMRGGGMPQAGNQAARRAASTYDATTAGAAAGVQRAHRQPPAAGPPRARSEHEQLPARAPLDSQPRGGRIPSMQLPARQPLNPPNSPPPPTPLY